MILSEILKEEGEMKCIQRTITVHMHASPPSIIHTGVLVSFEYYNELMRKMMDMETVTIDGYRCLVHHTRDVRMIGKNIFIGEIRYDCV